MSKDYEAFLASSAEIERRVNDGESIDKIMSSTVLARSEELLRRALILDGQDPDAPAGAA